jgi:hypothetical protein
MRARSVTGTVLAILVLATGCVTERRYSPPGLPESARLIEVGTAPMPDSAIRHTGSAESSPVGVAARHILVLSGGGMFGAYPVGVLKGWSASGRRPQFDVVTGVSTGALIAPFAFLGPEYDALLESRYTTSTADRFFRFRFPLALLWSDSLAEAEPLRRRLQAEITPELLDRIAMAHREGRRLYVGTTDLDGKRLVTWDLGAIAASDEPNKLTLFRDVLLASCSIPGLLPPVPIDIEVNGQRHTELHSDGAVSAWLFLPPSVLGVQPWEVAPPSAAGASVYVIVAGKLRLDNGPVERTLTRVSGESLITLLQTRLDGDLLRLYLLSRQAGANFQLMAVPEELQVGSNSLALDLPAVKRLFESGYQSGGGAWRHSLPGLEPGDDQLPRKGIRFVRAE